MSPPNAANTPRGQASQADRWTTELVAAVKGERARALARMLTHQAPAGYRERTSVEEAALDVGELLELEGVARLGGDTAMQGRHRFVVRPKPDGGLRLRRFADQPVELTALLPLLESFGFVVESSVPYRLPLGSDGAACIDDIGVHLRAAGSSGAAAFDPVADGPRLVRALAAADAGASDVDQLNALVPLATLGWRDVALLRAYCRYGAQVVPAALAPDLELGLLAYPAAARSLVRYFAARFDPRSGEPSEDAARASCIAEIEHVQLLRWDRALRMHVGLVDATLRTNFFQADEHGRSAAAVVLKFDSGRVPLVPPPPPFVETWVHAPHVEGLHLRGGLVARGGIRWSQRSDLRIEVLDLMLAQVKKNAVIVPTGAKGGFVCRGALASPDIIRAAYTTFVGSLLDITDNVVGGEVVTPARVVAHDGEDPYLVVAADRGTAELSDLANDISATRRFWLGDAFASGGSHGYNHKETGITARGAWVAVRRHFHQLGIDVQSDPVRVAGVGDMSGDVFGNGMLSSKAIHLVAAFDHRHIFIDPEPDASAAFDERRRLASLPRSSWADYSRDAISEGGGVWSRQAKAVPLSTPVQRALGVNAKSLSPPELISVILEAPVDLLWFGGIGTFIRAADENDADVGDHDNDEVRTTAERVRARVIGEGANLAVTQRGRIRYSRRGGRINTDFIDNAAGVAISDREVNLKILLADAVAQGNLGAEERDGFLFRAQDEVVAEVLRQVDNSVAALSRAVPQSAQQLDAYSALIDALEASSLVDRAVEALPDRDEIAVRRAAGAGMIRPELAVLLAYAKSDLAAAIGGAPYTRDPIFTQAVAHYFPAEMRDTFADLVARHRLYVPILATELASEVVDRLGIVWAHESAAELGRTLADAAACYWAAREVVGAGPLWSELDAMWAALPAETEARLHDIMSGAVARVARQNLRLRLPASPGELAARDRPIADALGQSDPGGAQVAELAAVGVDEELADRWLRAAGRAVVADVGPVVRKTDADPATVLTALAEVDAAAATDRMEGALVALPATDRWRSWLARAVLDDLADWRRMAACQLIRAASNRSDAAGDWLSVHAADLAAARGLLSTLDAPGVDPLTVVAVAVRRLPHPGREGPRG